LSKADIPPHSTDLPDRIIAHAMASQQPVAMKTGSGFSTWWGSMKAHHGQKMALAAALAAICIIVFDPAGKITKQYVDQQQMAEAQERYYVDGMPLLADMTLLDEQDLQMEDVVIYAGQG
jgi:hypothetical protein